MATKTASDARIDALEQNLAAVDAARVALEERVEKLEAAILSSAQLVGGKGLDSMGLPKVV